MALFLSPIPPSVLTELETRAKALGNSSGHSGRVDLGKINHSSSKWSLGRTPWIRAASFAVIRDSINPEFKSHWEERGQTFKDAKDSFSGNEPFVAHDKKHHHRLKNVLYGGGLQDLSGDSLNPFVYTNMVDDFASYNKGFGGHLASKLSGYKTDTRSMNGGPSNSDPNSRMGVPTPGILSMTCGNVGSLGSLKKIDMEIECHDFAQLQMVESLFMSPGITVLVEWGWSVNTKGMDIQGDLISLDDTAALSDVPRLHQKLLSKAKGSKYSYEGAVATITNYSWSAKPNGSFSCNVSLRSRGEALLGTQIKSAHAPLFESIKRITTAAKQDEFAFPIDDKGQRNRDYDEDGNMAQNYLESTLGTTPNNYYPSFHAASRSQLGLTGKLPGGTTDNLNFGTAIPPFPRWYYRYNAKNAAAQRGVIRDSALNSILSGKKSAGEQNAEAKRIAQDTIANYVSEILAPAIAKHSGGNGIKKGTIKPPSPLWNKSTYGGSLEQYGLKSIDGSTDISYGAMTGQKWQVGQTSLMRSFTKWFGFSPQGSSKPWTAPRESLSYDYRKWFSGAHSAIFEKTTPPFNIPAAGSSKVKLMYRPSFDDGKYQLLFGGYHPMGNGGDWGTYWQNSIMNPLRNNMSMTAAIPTSMNNAFYKYYTRVFVQRWQYKTPWLGVDAEGLSDSFGQIDYFNQITHPLLHLASKNYIGFTSNSGGQPSTVKHSRLIANDALGNTGNQLISAAGPLGILGIAMQNACRASGKENTLGFEAGFVGIKSYIQKHFGKIPSATDVAGYIGGVNPITDANYYLKNTKISGAQSAWTDLDMMVGEGADLSSNEESYGLPHRYTRGNVGRYFGAIHAQYPTVDIHARLQSGVNLLRMTSGRRFVPGNNGIYTYGSKTKKGYGENSEESGGRDDKPGFYKHQVRTLPSFVGEGGSNFQEDMMDYPMPFWGHYSAVDNKGNFKFVAEIAKNKKKFMSEVQEKKKNAALLKTQAFGEAYAKYEEYRQITDGDVFIPYSVLEKIINDNIGMETVEGASLLRFDSGDQEMQEVIDQKNGKMFTQDEFVTTINDWNDTGYKLSPASYVDAVPSVPTTGIQPINLEQRLNEYKGELVKQRDDEGAQDTPAIEEYSNNFGFNDASNNLTTYFFGDRSPFEPLPAVIYQIVSLPSKICNHKFLASTDPRVCILPGQTGVTAKTGENNAPDTIGDDAANGKIRDLVVGFKKFTDDPDRGYGFLPNILINTEFIFKCFDKSTTIKDALQKVLDGCSQACGNIWNFKFMIDGGVDSGVTRIIDANYANSTVDVVAEFPVQTTDSIVRSYSLESKIPNAMAVQALYGNNTTLGDGTVPNTLYELGNMFVDLAHENIQVPISNAPTEDGNKTFKIPKSATKRVQALGFLLSYQVHESLTQEGVDNCDKILRTILNDRAKAGPGDNALLDHNIIPLKMSFELDGISGIHFGHAVTATHLPARYKDVVCFQVTNVKQSITTSGWTTTVEAIMRRRPHTMGVYTIGSGGGTYDASNIVKFEKDQLTFSKNPVDWYREGINPNIDSSPAGGPVPLGYVQGVDAAEQAKNNNLSE